MVCERRTAPNPDSHCDSQANSHAHCHTDSDSHRDSQANPHAHRHTDSDSDSHCDSNPDSHTERQRQGQKSV